MSLKKSAAITGFAEMPSTKNPGDLTSMDIATRLAVQAVSDAGLEKGDIDGLLTVTPIAEPSILWPTALCEALKLELSYFDSVDLGGASSAGMIWRAAAAIHSDQLAGSPTKNRGFKPPAFGLGNDNSSVRTRAETNWRENCERLF